jgi:hypothetical protein
VGFIPKFFKKNILRSYFGRPITKYYETLDTQPKIEVCSLHLELYWFPLACLDGSESSTLGKGYGIKCGVIGNILGNELGTWEMCQKHIWNMVGTDWECDGNNLEYQTSKSPPHLPKEQNRTFLLHCLIG